MLLEYSKIIFITTCILVSMVVGNKGKWGFHLFVLSASVGSLLDLWQQKFGGIPYAVSFLLLFGPAYWFFIQTTLNNLKVSPKTLFHFIPFISSIVFIEYWQVLIFLGTLSQLVYLFFCFKQIKAYQIAIYEKSSEALTHNIKSIFSFLILLTTLIIVDLIRLNFQMVIGEYYNNLFVSTHNIIATVAIAYVAKFLLFNIDIFKGWSEVDKEPTREDLAAKDLFLNIEKIIEDGKYYLTPRLTLRELSDETGLAEKDISWAINMGKGVNFNDYINGLRVDTFRKNVIKCSGKVNILEQAYECGFNSKSAFNLVFKNITGETPSKFIKRYKEK